MSSPGTARLSALASSPAAPAPGYVILYFKTDNILYIKDSSGVETPLGSSSAITSLTGEASGVGPGAASVTLSNSAVIGKVLTGFVSGPSSPVLATDTLLQAIQKLQAQVSSVSGSAITALTGDVSASGPGSVAATVNAVGGKTASEISTSVDDTQDATSVNTASTIVKRDASGNFAANNLNINQLNASGTVTGSNLSGTNTGDVTVTDSSDIDLTLAGQDITANLTTTGVSAGSYGSGTAIPNFTVDNKGRLSAAGSTALTATGIPGFDEAAQDAVGSILTDTATIDFTYDDVANTITANVPDGAITDVKLSTGINANKIGSGSVDNTEFGYLNGVTSAIQTQLDGKASTTHASTHLPSGSDPLTTAAPSTSLSATTSNAEGTAESFSRSDHSHDILTGTASTIVPDQSNTEGSSSNLARADHIHNIPSGTPVQVGTSNFIGAAASFALSDHVHSHGNQTSGTLHAAATTSVNGFMSSSDKQKLDDATDLNTSSKIVQRDASGNFSASRVDQSTARIRGAGGNVDITADASTVSYSLELPPTQGAAGTYLTNDGTGNLSWSNPQVNIDGGRPDSVFVLGLNINGGTP